MSPKATLPKRYYIPTPEEALVDAVILSQINPGSRVIDLGCGNGRLLARLRDELNCQTQGVELALEALMSAVSRGLPVIQADLNEELREIPSDSFDVAVLSQTLQEVRHPKELLKEMLRISRQALVVVPNFGHWRVRLDVILRGRAPVTSSLPYEWFDTPNRRFMSLHDFRDLAGQLDCEIRRELPIIQGRSVDRAWAANLRADSVMYLLERTSH